MNNELHVVLGASGGIGSAVTRELVRRGKRVRAVNRSGRAEVPKGVEIVQSDVMNAASMREVCRGATVVFNCANVPYPEWEDKLPGIMDGAIEGAASANAKLTFSDNVYMYGPTAVPLTEDMPYRATGHKGKLRARLASKLMEAHQSGKVRVAIGRASDFYGPGVVKSLAGEDVFRAVVAGKKAMWAGRLDVPHTLTFIDDFARGLIILAERDEALGQVWHFGDAGALMAREFLQLAFEVVGKSPNIGVYTPMMIRLVGLFSPMVREVTENLYQYERPFVVDGSKFINAFGFKYTPHREAIKRTVEWYRNYLLSKQL